MNFQLSAQSEQLMREAMAQGGYASESDLVEEALQAIVDRNRRKAAYEAYLKREVAVGVAEIDRGEFLEYTDETLGELFEQIEAEVDVELAKRQSRQA